MAEPPVELFGGNWMGDPWPIADAPPNPCRQEVGFDDRVFSSTLLALRNASQIRKPEISVGWSHVHTGLMGGSTGHTRPIDRSG